MNGETNKREFTRIPISLEADVTLETGETISGVVHDLSMRGIFLPAPRRIPTGTECCANLYLGGRESGLRIEAIGVVARSGDEGLGVQFNEIAYEAFEHLRHLVQDHADDPRAVDDELSQTFGTASDGERG